MRKALLFLMMIPKAACFVSQRSFHAGLALCRHDLFASRSRLPSFTPRRALTTSLQARGFGTVKPTDDADKPQKRLADLAEELQTQTNRRILEGTVNFPSRFIVKVIGENDQSFENDVLLSMSRAAGLPVEQLNASTKVKGKFLSVTINPVFHSAESVYATYREVSKDPRVKFVL